MSQLHTVKIHLDQKRFHSIKCAVKPKTAKERILNKENSKGLCDKPYQGLITPFSDKNNGGSYGAMVQIRFSYPQQKTASIRTGT